MSFAEAFLTAKTFLCALDAQVFPAIFTDAGVILADDLTARRAGIGAAFAKHSFAYRVYPAETFLAVIFIAVGAAERMLVAYPCAAPDAGSDAAHSADTGRAYTAVGQVFVAVGFSTCAAYGSTVGANL